MKQDTNTLLLVRELKKYYLVASGYFRKSGDCVHAVDGVNLTLDEGETLGLVGESGCGKSTLAKVIAGLAEASSGSVIFDGTDITRLSSRQMRPVRREMQMVFQDPYASLNPRMKVEEIVGEPLKIHDVASGRLLRDMVVEIIERVGLSSASLARYPHEFSGGQRQRIGIARAIALRPRLIIADEPVSALDLSVQAQIINLLLDLREEFRLTFIFISHDLRIVEYVSDRVAVMYLGRIMEVASASELYAKPMHPYTEALIASMPLPYPAMKKRTNRFTLTGDIPSSVDPPSGCRFHTRCGYAREYCSNIQPGLSDVGSGHLVACHYPLHFE